VRATTANDNGNNYSKSINTSTSVLLIVGPKFTLASSHAVPLVSHGEYFDGTDRQTDRRTDAFCYGREQRIITWHWCTTMGREVLKGPIRCQQQNIRHRSMKNNSLSTKEILVNVEIDKNIRYRLKILLLLTTWVMFVSSKCGEVTGVASAWPTDITFDLEFKQIQDTMRHHYIYVRQRTERLLASEN